MARFNTLAFVLAGGKGERLLPLTQDTAKPALPFAGVDRVVDFVLSNLYHSGIRKIRVLTQWESDDLHDHIRNGWYSRFGIGVEESIKVQPPRETSSGILSQGTAEAVFRNLKKVKGEDSSIIDVFGADHIYLMDVSQMNDFHRDNQSDLTISVLPVRRELAAKNYGVLEIDSHGQVRGFEEKPIDPKPLSVNKEYCIVSMGNYVFSKETLLETLFQDSEKTFTSDKEIILANPDHFSKHDFGFDIIPAALRDGKRVFAYDFMTNSVPGQEDHERGYWRDIGNIEEFYKANMEIRSSRPPINLHNKEWEILTFIRSPGVVRFVGKGCALDSIVANGSRIIDAIVERSVISYDAVINANAKVSDSILLGDNEIGKGSVVDHAILDVGVRIPDKESVGVDKKQDEERGFYDYSKKIAIVPKDFQFK